MDLNVVNYRIMFTQNMIRTSLEKTMQDRKSSHIHNYILKLMLEWCHGSVILVVTMSRASLVLIQVCELFKL